MKCGRIFDRMVTSDEATYGLSTNCPGSSWDLFLYRARMRCCNMKAIAHCDSLNRMKRMEKVIGVGHR